MGLMNYLPKEASQECLSLAGTFVFQLHRLCGLPYIAVVWQVAVQHHLL